MVTLATPRTLPWRALDAVQWTAVTGVVAVGRTGLRLLRNDASRLQRFLFLVGLLQLVFWQVLDLGGGASAAVRCGLLWGGASVAVLCGLMKAIYMRAELKIAC